VRRKVFEADIEVDRAEGDLSIPIFYGYDELLNNVFRIEFFVYTKVLSYLQYVDPVVGSRRVEFEKSAREGGNEIVESPLNNATAQE